MNYELTEHFSLAEMTRSETAQRLGIDNSPNQSVVENLRNLCQQVLEPLRQWRGGPVKVSSGYRCERLNKAVGGVKTSQHMKGEAADLQVDRAPDGKTLLTSAERLAELRRLHAYIREHLPFDQLIWEHRKGGAYWIHVSCRRNASRNRHRAFSLVPGLRAN